MSRTVDTLFILALGLAGMASGTASAQFRDVPPDGYVTDRPEPYRNAGGVQYGQARVIRVDPVIVSGYGNDGYGPRGQRCHSRREDGYAGYGGYRDDGYRDGGYRNDRYRDDRYGDVRGGSDTGRNVATVVGGVVGAVLGSKVGGGSARYATAAVGSMVGGMAGREIYESSQRNRYPRDGVVTVCDPVPAGDGYYPVDDSRVGAYDVTWEYAGRTYTSRTDHHPGDTIRVRVDVQADE